MKRVFLVFAKPRFKMKADDSLEKNLIEEVLQESTETASDIKFANYEEMK